jgi:hypothetical protein
MSASALPWSPRTMLLLGFMLALAVALRLVIHVNTDVSWLITLDEKTLAGAKPYVDFLEVNPPASILLYMPAVMFAHGVHVAPEPVVIALVFALALASLAFSAYLLRGLLDDEDGPTLAVVAAFAVLVLPCYAFAQREHVALIAMLPMLAVYVLRATGARPTLGVALAAGIGGGLAVIIKAYFVLGLLLPFAFVLWRSRRLADLLAPENVVSAALALGYAWMVFALFPAFTHTMLPLVATLYVPTTLPLGDLLINGSTLLFSAAAVTTVLLAGRRLAAPLHAIALLAAAGFFIAMLVQAKGWPYQGYPAIALVLMVLGHIVLRGDVVFSRLMIVVYILLLAGAAAWFQANGEKPALREALAHEAPPMPKILAISGDIGLGHPLTRQLHGSWAGSTGSLWMTPYANYLLARGGLDAKTVGTIKAYTALERRLLAHDLRVNRPDVVLIAGQGWRDWAKSDPAIARELAAYHPTSTVDGVEIWLRASAAP